MIHNLMKIACNLYFYRVIIRAFPRDCEDAYPQLVGDTERKARMTKLSVVNMAMVRPGQKFLATVRAVRNEGVYVEMPDGRDGEMRMKALSAIRPGDEFEVVVRSIDMRARTLSLALVGCEDLMHQTKKTNTLPNASPNVTHYICNSRKPDHQPIPEGTVFLWDVANLFGRTGPEKAAWQLESISRSLAEQGYRSLFFIERRSLSWAKHNQLSAADVEALEMFARRDDFSVVADGGKDRKDEADCAILQVAEAIPNSICVSHDHYSDYAKVHSGIVGTDRVRSFAVTRLDGKLLICVSGLKSAIVVEPRQEEMAPASEAVTTPEVANTSVADARGEGIHTGLFAVADEYVRRGDAKSAERVYSKLAKKDSAAYVALADMYRTGVGVLPDAKKVARYERLALAFVKRTRERELRDRRRRVQSIRSGSAEPHFAAKRMQALNMVAFYEKHEKFAGTKGRSFTLGHAA